MNDDELLEDTKSDMFLERSRNRAHQTLETFVIGKLAVLQLENESLRERIEDLERTVGE